MKFLYTGDWHDRGTNPRNRLDNYQEALRNKLRQVFTLARKEKVDAIIQPGDIFDRPEVSIAVLLDFANLLKESPVQIWATAGNHDVYGYNLETYGRTSLQLLELLVPQLHVINEPTFPITTVEAQVTFSPYSSKMDKDGYGYSPECEPTDRVKIHVAHGMMLETRPPFDKYTLLDEAKTTANIVLTGHCHTGYGVYQRSDGVIFCNPGALMRISASASEMERPIQVALITVENGSYDVSLIPLQYKSAEEVLDRSKIEEEQQRQYAMEEFSALIESRTGEKILLDINDIVEAIAAQEFLDEDIVRYALTEIANQRANLHISNKNA